MSVKLQEPNRRPQEASSRQQHGSPSRLFALPDILHEAPALLHCLPSNARTALSSCNKQLRAYLRSMTKIILWDQEDDIAAVTTSEWHVLSMVVLPKADHMQASQCVCGDNFAHVATLRLADCTHAPYVELLTVESRQQNATQQLSAALLHLQQPQYATLLELVFYGYANPLNTHSIAKIVSAGWKQLVLRLSTSQLDANATLCLAGAPWPQLTNLSLTECGLDKAAMAGLVQRQWPTLKELDLSIDPLLGGAAISLLASANWPKLKSVELYCIPLCPGSFDWLSVKEWTELSKMNMRDTALNAPVVPELARTQFSHLRNLDLGDNHPGANAIAALVTASMHMLVHLDLSENQLDVVSTQWLSRGAWPNLESLDVCDNCLDNEAMQHLAQGQWQYLESLTIRE